MQAHDEAFAIGRDFGLLALLILFFRHGRMLGVLEASCTARVGSGLGSCPASSQSRSMLLLYWLLKPITVDVKDT